MCGCSSVWPRRRAPLRSGTYAIAGATLIDATGAAPVADAVFADLGVIRVDSIEDMLITAGAAAALGR